MFEPISGYIVAFSAMLFAGGSALTLIAALKGLERSDRHTTGPESADEMVRKAA